jgi:hypothetical protein
MFPDERLVHHRPKQRVETAIARVPAQPIELLVCQVAKPWHKRVSEQIRERKDVFGEAVGIGVMPTQAEHGVVLQQPIQNIWASRGEQDLTRVPKTEY